MGGEALCVLVVVVVGLVGGWVVPVAWERKGPTNTLHPGIQRRLAVPFWGGLSESIGLAPFCLGGGEGGLSGKAGI